MEISVTLSVETDTIVRLERSGAHYVARIGKAGADFDLSTDFRGALPNGFIVRPPVLSELAASRRDG